MWIEVSLGQNDLTDIAKKFSPLEIRLGDRGGFLRLTDPREIYMIPTVGLHLVCSGHLDWPLLGVKVPVKLHSLRLRVRPEVDKRIRGDALTIKLDVEHVDVAAIPDLVDDTITDVINRELGRKDLCLSWDFTTTLTHVFDLPVAFANPRSLGLRVIGGHLRIAEDALVLAIAFESETSRASAVKIGEYPEVYAS
ncbi:MAG: hypothetical protein ACRELY_27385 [Polyangiaceae bacterium]